VRDLFSGGAVKLNKGFAELPDRPGLGVALDEKVAAQHPYKAVTRAQPKFGDGAVADH
jgi:galactonate dehydratase